MNALAKKNGKLKDGNLPGEFLREGLTAIVTVKLPEAEFEGQTKVRTVYALFERNQCTIFLDDEYECVIFIFILHPTPPP